MKQWHPILGKLLRPAVEAHYIMQSNVAVGDAPRESDLLLLRRKGSIRPPYRGLWQHLTVWNVLEYKGPSVSPRSRDVDRLVELGLGIDRRLNEERMQRGQREIPAAEVSFWYLANHLGRRFLREVEWKVGALEEVGVGLWRSQVLRHPVFWVSSIDLPVEEDSLPLHVLGREPPEIEREVARLVAERPDLQQRYGGWLAGDSASGSVEGGGSHGPNSRQGLENRHPTRRGNAGSGDSSRPGGH
jgi:hypothetical protein